MTAAAIRPAARDLALRLLEHEFGGPKHPLRQLDVRTVKLTAHQADAVWRSRRVLRERGGVLIADSVGLGKTMIAIALVENAVQEGAARILVTSPAALRSHWWRPLRRVAREHRCSLIDVHGSVRAGPCIGWLSHAALSLGRWPAGMEPANLIVVDEAHAMRNPLTRRYRTLAGLCRPAGVVLLTATPVNNSLLDLYWQLRLFLGDDALADLGVADLRAAFGHALLVSRLDAPLDAAIATVVVKRTRAILENFADPFITCGTEAAVTLRFPWRSPPRAVRYDPDAAVPDFFAQVGERIAALRLEPFRASTSGSAGSYRAPVELMRFALLKRLESSVAAFASSLVSLAGYLDAFADAAAAGMLLDPRVHRGSGGGDDDQLALGHLALRPLPPGRNGSALAVMAGEDGRHCRELLGLVRPLLDADPKLAALEKLLHGPLAGRRTVVFTEFRDTAMQLSNRLRHRFRVALIHGGGARIGGLPAGRAETVRAFAPVANGRAPPPPAEHIDVLIATDVLAEGFNLQDAADVVSYDLPWNPVRLIQRAGRIDRLGSPHEVVHTWNFLPARGLDALLGLLARVSAKLGAIRALGAEPAVLGRHQQLRRRAGGVTGRCWTPVPEAPDMRPEVVVRRIAAGDPGLFDELERRNDGPFAVVERARAVWLRNRNDGCTAGPTNDRPRTLPGARRIWEPTVLALKQPAGEAQRTIVVLEADAGKALRWILIGRDGVAVEDRLAALAVLTSIIDPVARSAGGTIETSIDHGGAAVAAAIALGVVHLGRLDRQVAERQRSRSLRRVMLHALAREPGGPDAALCDRADALIQRTVEGFRAGVEQQIQEVVRTWRALPARRRRARSLLDRLEAALVGGTENAGPGMQSGPRVVAILQLQAARLSLPE